MLTLSRPCSEGAGHVQVMDSVQIKDRFLQMASIAGSPLGRHELQRAIVLFGVVALEASVADAM